MSRADGRDENLAMIEVAVLGVIFTLALFSNAFVLAALLRYSCKHPLSRMYWFMLHLCIADILVAIFNVLPQMIWDITHRFQGGDILCRAIKFLQMMPLYLSTYILVMMAIDRFRALVYVMCCNFGQHWSQKKIVHIMVGIAWIIAITLSVPQIFLFSYQDTRTGAGIQDCWVHFKHQSGAKIYTTWFILTIYIIPLLILIVCQFITSIKVLTWRKNVSKSTAKTVWLTLVVIIAYIACWTPWCVTVLWYTFAPPKNASAAMVIMLLLVSLNSCVNPWIYLTFSGNLLNMLCSPFGKVQHGCREHSIGALDQPPISISSERNEIPLEVDGKKKNGGGKADDKEVTDEHQSSSPNYSEWL